MICARRPYERATARVARTKTLSLTNRQTDRQAAQERAINFDRTDRSDRAGPLNGSTQLDSTQLNCPLAHS